MEASVVKRVLIETATGFGVLWRKRSQGTRSEQGHRWMERVLSLHHTCRIRGHPTCRLLVEAVSCLLKGDKPALRWLPQRASLLVPSPP